MTPCGDDMSPMSLADTHQPSLRFVSTIVSLPYVEVLGSRDLPNRMALELVLAETTVGRGIAVCNSTLHNAFGPDHVGARAEG